MIIIRISILPHSLDTALIIFSGKLKYNEICSFMIILSNYSSPLTLVIFIIKMCEITRLCVLFTFQIKFKTDI